MHQHLGDLRQEKECYDHALNIRIKSSDLNMSMWRKVTIIWALCTVALVTCSRQNNVKIMHIAFV